MDWTILGIAPTDDKKAITAAYRSRLRTTNPEDKPEEFKALRAAYEEALRLADQEQTPEVQDETPIGQFAARLEGIYADFSKRIDPQCWQELLQSDVCTGLDTRPQAEEALLRFLMEHYYLPKAVWRALDAVFAWQEREQELCESYPQEFIDKCVLGGIRLEQTLPYDLFSPCRNGAACDDYRRLYYKYGRASEEEQTLLLEQMEALPERHPYGEALRCHCLVAAGRTDEARQMYLDILRRYPMETDLNTDYALWCVRDGRIDEADGIVQRVLNAVPDNIPARRILAEVQIGRDQLPQAKETLYEIIHATGDDPVLTEQVVERLKFINETLVARYESALAANPGDTESAVELAWCHLQNEEPDRAMDVALKLDPEQADQFDYHNLMGKLYHHIEMFAEAADHLTELVALIRRMEPDGTAKTDKRIHRLPEMLQVLGSCLHRQGKIEEARAVFAEALAIAPDDPKVLTMMGQIHYADGEYEQSLEHMRHLTEVSPGSWFGHMMQAMCLNRLHRDREAYDAVNRAIDLQGGDLNLYALKMQLLVRNGMFEEVHIILDFLQDAGAPEDVCVDFIRAQLTELEEENTEAAFRIYQDIARQVQEGAPMLDAAQLYFRMAWLMGKKSDHKQQEDRDILLSMLDKGLEHDPCDIDCLDYKAWLLIRSDRIDEAIEIYKTKPIMDAKRKLADLYYECKDRYAAEALGCYEELLHERQTPELCFYAASCCQHLGDDKKAQQYFRLALELDPGDIDAHAGLAYAREAEGLYEEALAHMDQAVASMWEHQTFYDWLIEHRIKVLRRMGRYAEALAAADEAMDRGGYHKFPIQFEILCQFGLWDQAEALLAQWQRAARNDPDLLESTGRLHLLRRRMLKATFAYGKLKHKMTREEELTLRCQLSDLEANHKRLLQILPLLIQVSNDPTNPMLNLAMAMFWSGNIADAREAAAKALTAVDEELAKPTGNETLYRTRRSMLLALLGRDAEARAELALCRRSPLCRHCAYGSCKDADIYEACIEEIAGNYKRAMELHLAGQKNWPDELDFISGEIRLKKKKRG